MCAARERIPCGRGGLQVASLVVVEVTCRSLACALELVVAEVACRVRACAWALVVVEVTCRSLACALELVVAEVACRSRACAWALVVVEVTCRSLACALELVVLRPECPADAGRGREGTGASADSPIGRIRLTGEPSITDSGCWADEGIGSGAL